MKGTTRNAEYWQQTRKTLRTNNHKIEDYDIILDRKFGEEGTSSRIKAEEIALYLYSQEGSSVTRK